MSDDPELDLAVTALTHPIVVGDTTLQNIIITLRDPSRLKMLCDTPIGRERLSWSFSYMLNKIVSEANTRIALEALVPLEQPQPILVGPVRKRCVACGARRVSTYCRQCDQFFDACNCPHGHIGHLTY